MYIIIITTIMNRNNVFDLNPSSIGLRMDFHFKVDEFSVDLTRVHNTRVHNMISSVPELSMFTYAFFEPNSGELGKTKFTKRLYYNLILRWVII